MILKKWWQIYVMADIFHSIKIKISFIYEWDFFKLDVIIVEKLNFSHVNINLQ